MQLRRGRMRLLLHQLELLAARKKFKIRVLQGGYRSGKTVAGVAAVVDMGLRSEGAPILVVAPTYRLVRDVFVATAMKMLDLWGLPWTYHESKHILTVGGPLFKFQILCRSADKPRSIEGLTVGGLLVDEWELCPREALVVAFARVSIGPCQEIVLTGTPEGYGPGYDLVLKNQKPSTWVKVVDTANNPLLREGYRDEMAEHMDEDTAREKLAGERRAKTGRVYSRFDRKIHGVTPCVPPGAGAIQIWADFNVEHMTWVVAETDRENRRAHIIGELIGPAQGNDTAKQAEAMKEYLAKYFTDVRRVRCSAADVERMRLTVYPDATAGHRSSLTPKTHAHLLRQAGFKVKHGRKNPPVEDRVNTLLVMFRDVRLTIDCERAPWTLHCFEHQVRVDGEPDKANNIDHAPDAVGYGCFWQFPVWRRPPEKPDEFAVS